MGHMKNMPRPIELPEGKTSNAAVQLRGGAES
jgi:hypothetical protein